MPPSPHPWMRLPARADLSAALHLEHVTQVLFVEEPEPYLLTRSSSTSTSSGSPGGGPGGD